MAGLHQHGFVQHAHLSVKCFPLGTQWFDGGLGISQKTPGLPLIRKPRPDWVLPATRLLKQRRK